LATMALKQQIFFYGKANEKRMLGTGCFVRQSIVSTFMSV